MHIEDAVREWPHQVKHLWLLVASSPSVGGSLWRGLAFERGPDVLNDACQLPQRGHVAPESVILLATREATSPGSVAAARHPP